MEKEKEKIRKRSIRIDIFAGILMIVVGIVYIFATKNFFEGGISIWVGTLLIDSAEHESDISNLEKRIEELEKERNY